MRGLLQFDKSFFMRLAKCVPVLLDLRIREESLYDIVAAVDGGKVIGYVDVAGVEGPASGGRLAKGGLGWVLLAALDVVVYVSVDKCGVETPGTVVLHVLDVWANLINCLC